MSAFSKAFAVLGPTPGMRVSGSFDEMSVFMHQSLMESVDAEDLFGWSVFLKKECVLCENVECMVCVRTEREKKSEMVRRKR